MTTPTQLQPSPTASKASSGVETNGLNSIPVYERRGTGRDLFPPWFAANISVLSVSFGAFILGFGLSLWQAVVVLVVGVVGSNILVGVIALAGKRASAPTMTISRCVYGVRGNRFPAALSWVLNAGWETVLAVVAVLATATIFRRLGWGGGTPTKVVALIVIVGLIMIGGVYGFTFIMKVQKWVTLAAGILTLAYIGFSLSHVSGHALTSLPNGSAQEMIGAILFTMTGYGLGWVQAGADYSRYLPRSASSGGVVWWTTLGASLPPVILLLFGTLLAGSSKPLDTAIGADPVGALTQILPTWFLVPFTVVTVLGLVAGGIMDNYSSGLSLLNAGVKVSRVQAVSIDGLIMFIGTIGVVFFTSNFVGTFEGFLSTIGVPTAAWAGTFLADIALRRRDYSERDMFLPSGRYGDVRWMPIALVAAGAIVGWGLVTNTSASWLKWQGYLLGPLGLGGRNGSWAYAELGVFAALVTGFAGYLVFGWRSVRAQEALPLDAEVILTNKEAQSLGGQSLEGQQR